LQALVASGGRNRTEIQAFSEIRKLDEIAVPRPERVLRAPSNHPQPDEAPTVWEAVLHPATTLSGDAVPLDDETRNRWITLVQANHGQVYESFIRRVGGLTFVPVSVAAAEALRLARFNPLRVLRPMPAIRPRPRFGLRSVQRVTPPANPQPMSTAATVAVFDGGVDGGYRRYCPPQQPISPLNHPLPTTSPTARGRTLWTAAARDNKLPNRRCPSKATAFYRVRIRTIWTDTASWIGAVNLAGA
jgi:hypothetical protein